MSDDKQTFIDMSVALTGIASSILAPPVTNVNLVDLYYDAMTAKYGVEFSAMLEKFSQLTASGSTPDQAVQTIIEQSEFSGQACNMNFLWYMGGFGTPSNDFGATTQLLSTIAYQKGMVWQVMQSHPMGYTLSRYGYWAHDPAPLEQYVGSTSSEGGQAND